MAQVQTDIPRVTAVKESAVTAQDGRYVADKAPFGSIS
jgi:hypothetical protein